jgi:DNA-binding NtrC family response regulator
MDTTTSLIGASSAIKFIREEIDYAARSDAKVLLTGESGVGKEVVAQLIHRLSRRRHAPMVTINCAGIPDTLLASELFGHVRGSFTDAYRDKQGWLEQAHRSTIFMDEIGEMSLQMQSLLLRFLENGEIQRVGSDRKTTTVDVRIIAATNQRLLDRVASGAFRADLFYRLNVIHIEIPPLRDRREDVPVLMAHFLKQFSERHHVDQPQISDEAAIQLQCAAWPGNVRQLRNIAERLVVRASGVISVADLPREILSMAGAANASNAAPARARTDVLFERMTRDGETFWTVVYEPFMARDLTRDEVRALVRQGLELSRGSYKALAQMFNVPGEYKRLLNFLRKYQCHMPIQDFRSLPVRVVRPAPARQVVGG